MLFSKMVELLDSVKETYYLLHYLSDTQPGLRKIARRELTRLTKRMNSVAKAIDGETPEQTLLDTIRGYIGDVQATHTGEASLGSLFNSIKDDARANDIPFYSNYGEFWNEVPLPASVESVFIAYINKMAASKVEGMRGVSGTVDEFKGDWGYSIYDLSDIMVVFDSEEHARKFHEEDGVEPYDFMQAVAVIPQENVEDIRRVIWQCM